MLAGYESVLGDYSTMFKAISAGGWLFVIAALVGHIGDNLKDMGLPIPDALTARGVRAMTLTTEFTTLDPPPGPPPPAPPFVARRE